MIEKAEIISLIEKHLLAVIREYHSTKVIGKFPADDRLILKKVWEQGLGFTNMNLQCPSCIKYGLDVLGTWYDRQKAIEVQQVAYMNDIAEAVNEALEEDEPLVKKNKGGRPRKNKD